MRAIFKLITALNNVSYGFYVALMKQRHSKHMGMDAYASI